jgi:hypothetical protein
MCIAWHSASAASTSEDHSGETSWIETWTAMADGRAAHVIAPRAVRCEALPAVAAEIESWVPFAEE